MKKQRILIWPSSVIYIFLIFILGLFALAFFVFSFYSLFYGEPIKIFDIIEVKNKIVQFSILILIACMMAFFFMKLLSFKIIFTDEFLFSPRISSMQRQNIRLRCNELIEFRILQPLSKDNGAIYQYLEFKFADGKIKKLWIKPFTKKQVERILNMIQERGGLQNQKLHI